MNKGSEEELRRKIIAELLTQGILEIDDPAIQKEIDEYHNHIEKLTNLRRAGYEETD